MFWRYLLAFSVVFFGASSGCKCKNKEEINKWDFGKGSDKVCPTLGVYPVFIESKKFPEKYGKDIKNTMERWNRESKELGGGVLFDSLNSAKNYRKPKTWLKQWPVIVNLEPAPEYEYKSGKSCEPILKDADPFIQNTTFGWTQFRIEDSFYVSGRIQICDKKYELVRSFMNDTYRLGQRMREGGMYRLVMHELGHIIFGNGTKHPTMYGDVMAKSPLNDAIHFHVRELLRQRVIEPCTKMDRFGQIN